MTSSDLGQYCRAIETHLCQVNQGHLVRIVGPAFDMVKRWHAAGVPLKIALRGVDRRAARASRSASASRRPLRLEFCEADVLDVFDQWRRAIGFALPAGQGAAGEGTNDAAAPGPTGGEDDEAGGGRGPSLPKHLERVMVRLSSFLASESEAGPALRASVGATLDAVERLRGLGRVRGAARRAALEELRTLDEGLLAALSAAAPEGWLDNARREARIDLGAYEARLPAAEFDRLVDRAAQRLLRAQLQLPELRLA
jgi:hypothetical protein